MGVDRTGIIRLGDTIEVEPPALPRQGLERV
jgi:hypothetical protein